MNSKYALQFGFFVLPVAALALAAASSSVVFAIRAREATRTAALEADRAGESTCQLLESQRLAAGLHLRVKDLEASRARARKRRDRAESELEESQVRLRKGERERESLQRNLRLVRGESTLLPDSAGGSQEYAEPVSELEKAYKDMAEMEKQLVDVSRAKNDVEQQLACLRERGDPKSRRIAALEKQLREAGIVPLPDEPDLSAEAGYLSSEPKIDGVILGVSDKVNLILISVGGKDKVQVGYKFTVYRGSSYVSKLVVDRVEDGWAACRELTDFRKEEIIQGDNVSTRVFD